VRARANQCGNPPEQAAEDPHRHIIERGEAAHCAGDQPQLPTVAAACLDHGDQEPNKELDSCEVKMAEKFLVEDFTDPEVVAKFLEEYGSIGDLYRAAPKESREELIDYLIDQEQLRAELASILPAEEDSAMRSYILDRVEPDGFFDSEREEDLDNPEIDDELIALLENPTATPIGREEWLSRMELAHLIDDQYALNWVRDGLDVFPGDKDVALLAHALTLTIGATLGNLSNAELNRSSDYLYSTLGGAAFATYNSDQRIRAYYALYWVPDRSSSAAFYTATLAVETDPRARDVLTGLIDRINSQAAAGH